MPVVEEGPDWQEVAASGVVDPGLAAHTDVDLATGTLRHREPRAPRSMTRQAAIFTVVGTVSTLAYLLLYAALRLWVSAQVANFIATIATTLANTAANRRFTFNLRGPAGVLRQQTQGLLLFAISLGFTAAGLAALHATDPSPSRIVELEVLLAANLVASVLRFVLLRSWVFRRPGGDRRHGAPPTDSQSGRQRRDGDPPSHRGG